jgi:two-component system, NarL family, nitrate/nitrite response regulator NarL
MNLAHRPANAVHKSATEALDRQAMSIPMIAVLLAGGETLLREGVKHLFEGTPLRVVGEVEALGASQVPSAETATLAPAIILVIDPELRQGGAPPWQPLAIQAGPQARVVALFGRGGDRQVLAALLAGADGCLFSTMSAAVLVQAIQLVALGGNVFPTSVSAAFVSKAVGSGDPHLTPRERDILRGLVAGRSNKEIANSLGTTDMTVKAQLRHLLRKLVATNRTQATLWAHENGFE